MDERLRFVARLPKGDRFATSGRVIDRISESPMVDPIGRRWRTLAAPNGQDHRRRTLTVEARVVNLAGAMLCVVGSRRHGHE